MPVPHARQAGKPFLLSPQVQGPVSSGRCAYSSTACFLRCRNRRIAHGTLIEEKELAVCGLGSESQPFCQKRQPQLEGTR
jgi:hypothetical protein